MAAAVTSKPEGPKQDDSSAFPKRLQWIERIYTIAALFLCSWAVIVTVGIYTRKVETFPVFGSVTFTEQVVYTLYVFSVGVPCLLGIALWHRIVILSSGHDAVLPTPHFKELPQAGRPAFFATLSFMILVGVPIATEWLAYDRLYKEICIVWKPPKWWKTENCDEARKYRRLLERAQMFTLPPRPPDGRDYANWRFARVHCPDGRVEDLTERTPLPDDDDGRPEWAKRKEPSQISAAPGYVPWVFRISLVGSVSVFASLIVTRKRSVVRRVSAAALKFSRQWFTKRQNRHC